MTQNSEVNFDMLTLNETGPQAGRYLHRTHEVRPYAALSRIDLWTGENELLVERFDWESFDGLVWTPWGTILMAEERIVQSYPDPDYPAIERGLVYEYHPQSESHVMLQPLPGETDSDVALGGIARVRGAPGAPRARGAELPPGRGQRGTSLDGCMVAAPRVVIRRTRCGR